MVIYELVRQLVSKLVRASFHKRNHLFPDKSDKLLMNSKYVWIHKLKTICICVRIDFKTCLTCQES